MARNGFKKDDADTHSGAPMDILMRYLTEAEKEKLKPYEPYKETHRRTGHINYHFGSRHYQLSAGSAPPLPTRKGKRGSIWFARAVTRTRFSTTSRRSGSRTWIWREWMLT